MGEIRPLVDDDISAIVALRQRKFRKTYRPSAAELGAYMREMFLSDRHSTEALPSLVYEDGSGRPVGFLGIFPRRMLLDGAPIHVAVMTQLVVEDEGRGVGTSLLQECFRGAQDFSFADAAGDRIRRLWERAGGRTALLYSLYWTRPLRPWRYTAAGIGGGRAQRVVRLLARPLLAVGDAAAARLVHSWFRQAAPVNPGAELTLHTVAEHWPTVMRDYTLVAQYDERFLEYALRQSARKPDLGVLQQVLVHDRSAGVIGWYIYYANEGEIGQVVLLAAAPDKYDEILDHMFYHAWRRGLVALQGRLVPRLMPVLTGKHCVLTPGPPWALMHSARPEILAAVDRGDAMISRLDGEFWMAF